VELFHITSRGAWEAARPSGSYSTDRLSSEGFIHLSTSQQWRRVARDRYSGHDDLVLLRIDGELLSSEVRFETADGDRFPHLYGPLEVAAVIEATEFAVSPDGRIAIEKRNPAE
jgi:uncharacterized protein (DUF952 family)